MSQDLFQVSSSEFHFGLSFPDPDTTATELHNQAAPPSGGGPDYVQGLRGQQPQQSARNVQDAIQRLLLQHGAAGSGLGMGQGLNFPPPGNPGLPPNLGLGVLGAEPEVVGRKPDMNSAMTVEDLERSFSSEHAQGKNMSEGLEKQQVLSRDVEDSKRAGLGDLRQAAPPGFKGKLLLFPMSKEKLAQQLLFHPAQGPPSVPFPASLQPERPQPGGVQPNLIGMPGLGLFNLNPAQQQQLLHSTLQHQAHLSQLHQPSTAAAADLPMPIPQAFMTSPFGMPLLGTAIQKPTPPMEMPEAIGTKSGGEPSRGLGCLGLTGLGLSPQKSSPMGLGPALTTANLMGVIENCVRKKLT